MIDACCSAAIAVLMHFIGFVVVVCVISEAAGKTVERQKGKAVVRQKDTNKDRWEDNVYHASAMHRCQMKKNSQIWLVGIQPVFWRQ